MSTSILQAAQAEERALEAELEASPAYRKLTAVRAVIALYIGTVVGEPPRTRQSRVENVGRSSRSNSRASVITKAAVEVLTEMGRRARSGEIMQALMAKGFEFAGDKPSTGLASVLSHSELFDNVKNEGYGLTSWHQGESPSGPASDEAGSPEQMAADPQLRTAA